MRITNLFVAQAALVATFALCPAAPALASPPVVSAFYYPWFGTFEDGGYAHWAQNGHAPPDDIASNYYPAYGPYSSSNAAVIATQLSEAERAGIDELAVSWWGRGSSEDKVLPDVVTYEARVLARLCNEAHALRLLCAPPVGPGYDARRAVGDPHVKPRRHGQTYDAMWHAALAGGADRVTITSFNEWQEGTQIEPAMPIRLGEYRYISYDGAWGLHGAAAQYAYLDRTAFWA